MRRNPDSAPPSSTPCQWALPSRHRKDLTPLYAACPRTWNRNCETPALVPSNKSRVGEGTLSGRGLSARDSALPFERPRLGWRQPASRTIPCMNGCSPPCAVSRLERSADVPLAFSGGVVIKGLVIGHLGLLNSCPSSIATSEAPRSSRLLGRSTQPAARMLSENVGIDVRTELLVSGIVRIYGTSREPFWCNRSCRYCRRG